VKAKARRKKSVPINETGKVKMWEATELNTSQGWLSVLGNSWVLVSETETALIFLPVKVS